VIVAKKCGPGNIDCSPDYNYLYRFLFILAGGSGFIGQEMTKYFGRKQYRNAENKRSAGFILKTHAA
jgi:hypothetical protein